MTTGLVQAGTWSARALHGNISYTKTGKEQVTVQFALLDGPDKDRQVTWTGFFTEACFERTIKSLRYTGWKGDDLSDLSTIGDADCQVTVEHQSYEGKTYARVAWVNSVGGVTGTPMATSAMADFARKMQPKIAQMGPSERDTDDVPF